LRNGGKSSNQCNAAFGQQTILNLMKKSRTREQAKEIVASETINKVLPDEVVKLFIGQYVEAAKDRVIHAQTSAAKWRVLRAICADLTQFRQTGHQNERLELWKQRLKADIASRTEAKEEQLIQWAKQHPELEKKLFPRVHIGEKEKEKRMRGIFGQAPRTPAEQLRRSIYDVIIAREALGIPENAPLPTREEADAAWRKWEKEHGEQFHEEFEAERVKEQKALNPGKEIEEIDAAVDKLMAPKRR
jgi:hypothetical protein